MASSNRELLLDLLVRAIVLFTAMPIHECAHGVVADRLGDNTPRDQGRLTLNPFVHLSLFGSILLLATGFGWAKPVQVDTRNFKNPRRDMAITSAAGPISNILMALVVMIIFKILLVNIDSPILRNQTAPALILTMLQYMISVNLSLAVFNLIPVPPLDGSKIIAALLPEKAYYFVLKNERYIGLLLFAMVFTGFLGKPIGILVRLIYTGLDFITIPFDILLR